MHVGYQHPLSKHLHLRDTYKEGCVLFYVPLRPVSVCIGVLCALRPVSVCVCVLCAPEACECVHLCSVCP